MTSEAPSGRLEAERALAAAIRRPTEPELGAWAGTGQSGLEVLSDLITGAYLPEWGLHPKDEIDGLAEAVAAIATARPAAFLDAFRDARFDDSPTVLIGLGSIADREATRRLARAARSDDTELRVHAVIGLGRRQDSHAEAVLRQAIADPEYLVRYHALIGLATSGTPTSLQDLEAFVATSVVEGELAEEAITAIRQRSDQPT